MDSKKLKVALAALKKIKSKAYDLAWFNPVKETGREAWDIFWLAAAGLEGTSKASALDTVAKMSGVSTDDPERTL